MSVSRSDQAAAIRAGRKAADTLRKKGALTGNLNSMHGARKQYLKKQGLMPTRAGSPEAEMAGQQGAGFDRGFHSVVRRHPAGSPVGGRFKAKGG